MRITLITLFPEILKLITEYGVISRAIKNNSVVVNAINPRQFAKDKHATVDDRPYGGGPGMLMMAKPLVMALRSAQAEHSGHKIYLSPQGKKLEQNRVNELAKESHLILLAGRYEGIDERVIASEIDEEISLGDFVLSGGEIAGIALMDSVLRVVPGVLGHQESAQQDSFVNGLLDYPHYTRPEIFEGSEVPKVLLSGNHQAIESWRLKQSLGRTWLRRKDLLAKKNLTEKQKLLLEQFIKEFEDTKTNQK